MQTHAAPPECVFGSLSVLSTQLAVQAFLTLSRHPAKRVSFRELFAYLKCASLGGEEHSCADSKASLTLTSLLSECHDRVCRAHCEDHFEAHGVGRNEEWRVDRVCQHVFAGLRASEVYDLLLLAVDRTVHPAPPADGDITLSSCSLVQFRASLSWIVTFSAAPPALVSLVAPAPHNATTPPRQLTASPAPPPASVQVTISPAPAAVEKAVKHAACVPAAKVDAAAVCEDDSCKHCCKHCKRKTGEQAQHLLDWLYTLVNCNFCETLCCNRAEEPPVE